MTNPKHTDTSRSGDLVERLRSPGAVFYEYGADKGALLHSCADRIEALEARVAELEGVVGDLLTRFDPWSPHDHDAAKRARAALETKHDQ